MTSQSEQGSSPRRVRALRALRRIVILAAGWGLVAVGIVGLALPFLQGIAFIILGLVLLSLYSPLLERFLFWLIQKFPSLEKSVRDRHQSLKLHVLGDEGMIRVVTTLCVIHDHENKRVLLGMKKRGFGEGKWNGFGGKVAKGEGIEDAAHRELWEEAGIQAHDLSKVGVLDFEYIKDGKLHEVHIFRITQFEGEPMESEEMLPQWFNTHEIPFEHMWPDDSLWMPMFLSGKKFRGRMRFEGESIVEHELEETDLV